MDQIPCLDPELQSLFHIEDVSIDWHAILKAGYSVSRVRLSQAGPHKLGCVFLMWFTRNGAPVCHLPDRARGYPEAHVRYPEKGDSPVTVGQAARTDFRHPWMWQQRIDERVQEYRLGAPVQLRLPAYKVGPGYLLLNGAHRSIAILRASVEYNIELVVINGPIDQGVLRDLVAFE